MDQKVNEFFKSKKIIIIAIALLVIIFGAVIANSGSSLDKIYDSYHKNAATCIEKYDGQEVKIKVRVNHIDSSLSSILVGEVKDDNPFNFMSCKLKTDKLQKKAKKLKNGDVITVKGTIHISEVLGMVSIDMDTTDIS